MDRYAQKDKRLYNVVMEQDILNKLNEQNIKIDAIYKSVEKTRRYFTWTLIISVVVIVLPLIALLFIIPTFISQLQMTLPAGL